MCLERFRTWLLTSAFALKSHHNHHHHQRTFSYSTKRISERIASRSILPEGLHLLFTISIQSWSMRPLKIMNVISVKSLISCMSIDEMEGRQLCLNFLLELWETNQCERVITLSSDPRKKRNSSNTKLTKATVEQERKNYFGQILIKFTSRIWKTRN